MVSLGDAPDFVEVGEVGIAADDAMRHQRCLQLICYAFGLMDRKRSSQSRQVLVSFQSTESLGRPNMPAAVQRKAIAVFCHRFTLRQTLSVPSRCPLAR